MPSKSAPASHAKHYILDTNVLIHDPGSPFQFQENTVWIPVEVFEELDRFKSESSTRGANAREVHRRLSERFRTAEDMKQGVTLENGGRLRVVLSPVMHTADGDWQATGKGPRFQLLRDLFPDMTVTDNRILAAACAVSDAHSTSVVLVTKDLNVMLKARTLGLQAQDYRTDRVDDGDIPRTMRRKDEEYQTLDVSAHN